MSVIFCNDRAVHFDGFIGPPSFICLSRKAGNCDSMLLMLVFAGNTTYVKKELFPQLVRKFSSPYIAVSFRVLNEIIRLGCTWVFGANALYTPVTLQVSWLSNFTSLFIGS